MKRVIVSLFSSVLIITTLGLGGAFASADSSAIPATSGNKCNNDTGVWEMCGKVYGTGLYVSTGKWTFSGSGDSPWCGHLSWIDTTGGQRVTLASTRYFCVDGSSANEQSGNTTIDYQYPANGTLVEQSFSGGNFPQLSITNSFSISK